MAIIDKLKKISDVVWELPASHKESMRVPARIIATEKLVREMDEAVYEQIRMSQRCPGLHVTRSACPMATAVMDFPSAVLRRWTCTKAASFHRAASGSTLTAACASSSP